MIALGAVELGVDLLSADEGFLDLLAHPDLPLVTLTRARQVLPWRRLVVAYLRRGGARVLKGAEDAAGRGTS